MSDLFSPLREPEHLDVPPVEDVRRRGEQIRRRRSALAAGAVAAVVAGVVATSAVLAGGTTDRSSAPQVATQTPSATATATPDTVTRIPAGLDLTQGLEDPGSDGRQTAGSDVRWLSDIVLCDAAYSPADTDTDHTAVLWEIPQMMIGRDLRAYADAGAARAAATDMIDKLRACPTFSLDGGVSQTTNEVRDLESSGDAWLVTQTYTTDGVPQIGQSIVVVEQVGNTVLVAQSYSEEPGSTDPEAMMRTARDFVDSLAGVRYEIGCGFQVATCS